MGKRIRRISSIKNESKPKRLKPSPDNKSNLVKRERCNICKQYLDKVLFYNGHMNNSSEEIIALATDSLCLFNGDEANIHQSDEFSSLKLTSYTVYDENGHLCPFDTGLIEKNIFLYVSGYIKPIWAEDPSNQDGIPTHSIGPINEWFISGFDGGEKAILGIATSYATYFLMEPSEEYTPIVQELLKKIYLVKIVIEFLIDNEEDDPTYEDLLDHLDNCGNADINQEFMLLHAQFVCDHIYSCVVSLDNDETDQTFITLSCVRTLVELAGVTFRNRRRQMQLDSLKTKTKTFTKAVTTPLVHSVFEHFFPDQMDNKESKLSKKKRCGVCDACQTPDCGKCANCQKMVKFGGAGKLKQACKLRICPNMAIAEMDLSDNENDDEDVGDDQDDYICRKEVNITSWGDKEPVFEDIDKKYYSLGVVGDVEVKIGDFVMLSPPEKVDEALTIGRIEYMYEDDKVGLMIHVHLFCPGTETILGKTADSQELFVTNTCEDAPLGCVVRKAEVAFKATPQDWFELGGIQTLPPHLEHDGDTFFYSKTYNKKTATFTDVIEPERDDRIDSCGYCKMKIKKKEYETPSFDSNTVVWKGEVYKVGSVVFLDPSAYNFRNSSSSSENVTKTENVDETIYTERYRKTNETQGSNQDTPDPFIIAEIEDVIDDPYDVKILVRIYWRPDNTQSSIFLSHPKDLNLVYWSEAKMKTNFSNVRGKCYLRYFDSLETPREWYDKGPYRYYFTESYDYKNCTFCEVPDGAKKTGYQGKGKGKKTSNKTKTADIEPEWEPLDTPLKCMDVFAGCGGLSEGLHQSGVVETKWAIEIEPSAAQAFKLNNKKCKVFTGDCNEVLRQIISNERPKNLPEKGEVEVLVGGPPCQGFSVMNHFNAGQYSLFKNSLVVTYLSYCEYYRPKYFILENVRNFVSFKHSMVLKLTLRCLLAMGYQVTFGILQAGHYGVPQTRRRLILLAAAPGYVLPKFPEPLHVFNRRGCHLSIALDGQRFTNGNIWTDSAPYRTICVRDAIADLPEIKNGWNKIEMPYDDDAVSHFQRKMRGKDPDAALNDHVCKEMSALIEARISHIPIHPGSDWRDLPNISLTLRDGSTIEKLRYPYRKKKQKADEPNRGVCKCASGNGNTCDPADRQLNTLIPWCLPHTGDRHVNWSGLYGRLEWDGFFGTTITNPEPISKQGRVLHPEQNRVVSVRECARSQGFPDKFKFFGGVMDKHRQVGNAVPPPLARAIGLELRKALIKTIAFQSGTKVLA